MSDKKDNNSSNGGLGFGGVLAIVFITLKLCKIIDWSWWWVLAPIWIPVGLFVLCIILAKICK